MAKVVVITGAGAGVGRATVEEFARQGFDVGLLSRDAARLERAANDVRRYGVNALPIPTDVADPAAVEAAADRVEAELGPIDIWVNVAMATIFSPVAKLTAEEVERGTKVTYLGQVHGMMTALKRMRVRNRGTIVNVGSALAYRSVPLQSVYCGAKAAIRGFTDSLRSEIIHDKLDVHLTMVDLPAVNTPQFDWALNKMGRKAKPVAPIFEPEVPARAIFFAATHKRRDVWVGWSTVKAILANRIAPGLIDRYLAKAGYSGQLADRPTAPNAPANLFKPVSGDYSAHGRFDAQSRDRSWEMFTDRHKASVIAVTAIGLAVVALRAAKRLDGWKHNSDGPRTGRRGR
ncbi:short-chain dehydrogenase [Mesorhizobium sp. SARCC-RB16n]|uniref:SDR family oxidoreductase n=1 Tax=Mesorhizobium sp. SARCC-RB16n TaxID=2116687 RepID=UPI00122F285B|nr:SDR family oxidoreductase [Mesorhizobium sp. SARCC-RB16n]KAA3452276.1 short-chain dehydrogenase [Mesorhizobium sp. SARCC-RB16n]